MIAEFPKDLQVSGMILTLYLAVITPIIIWSLKMYVESRMNERLANKNANFIFDEISVNLVAPLKKDENIDNQVFDLIISIYDLNDIKLAKWPLKKNVIKTFALIRLLEKGVIKRDVFLERFALVESEIKIGCFKRWWMCLHSKK